jgi:hypothetical protein
MSQSDDLGGADGTRDVETLEETARYLKERLAVLNDEVDRRLDTLDDADVERPEDPEREADIEALDREALAAYVDDLERAVEAAEETLDTLEERVDEELNEHLVDASDEDDDDEWPPEAMDNLTFDVGSVVQYMTFLANEFDSDTDQVEALVERLAEVIGEEVETEADVHHASYALWYLLVNHEDNYFDEG